MCLSSTELYGYLNIDQLQLALVPSALCLVRVSDFYTGDKRQ